MRYAVQNDYIDSNPAAIWPVRYRQPKRDITLLYLQPVP